MDTSSPRSLPELARSIRPWAFGAAFAVALGFHFFLSHAVMGWPLALFALIITGGIILITQESHGLRNRWALLFLIPLLSASTSAVLYSSDVIKGVAFFTIAGSLAALAYWLTAPAVNWRKGVHLWKVGVFLDSALPFRHYPLLFTEANGSRRLNSKLLFQIGIGLVVAGPILLIFLALFLQGDRYFDQVMSQWVSLDFVTENIVRLFFDVIVALFAVGFFWRIASRSRTEPTLQEPRTLFQEIIAARSFLFAIAALFIIFAGFQIFYLFQGSGYILAQGRTYADYAVSGYQQLCLAAAFAFLILLVIYRLTGMEDRWIRIGSLIVAVTSIISTLSAGKRLWLYVDAYGLTLSRSWGMQFLALVVLAFILLIISLKQRWNVLQFTSAGSALALGLLSLTILLNHEGFVARYNLARYTLHTGPRLDTSYLTSELSADAIPSIAKAVGTVEWDADPGRRDTRLAIYNYWQDTVLPRLQTQDPRQLTLSDLRAEWVLRSIPDLKP